MGERGGVWVVEVGGETSTSQVLGWLDGFFAGGKFAAGGEAPTLADLCLLATYTTLGATGCTDLAPYTHAEAWLAKMVKLVPNYEKANGAGAAEFGALYKSKAAA